MNPDASARYLEYQVPVQRDAMQRRGVAEELIARELKLMETAIRRELQELASRWVMHEATQTDNDRLDSLCHAELKC